MAKYAAPKGTHDVFPGASKPYENSRSWDFLETAFRDLARLYGYEEVRTPIFEQTELFTRAVGEGTDIVSKEMYTFDDKGGRSMTLRPEGTAPVLRAYIENSIYAQGGVSKLFYIGPIFRYERPQEGRFRQHTQFGVEALGSRDPRIDAETIALALNFYNRIGLDRLIIKINTVGCSDCRPAYRTALLDFVRPVLDQMSPDNQRRFIENPLRMLDSKDEGDCKLLADAPNIIDYICDDCSAHFDKVREVLGQLKIDYALDLRLVRGFDYYTKTAFEIQSPDLGAQSAIGGGGRYDNLVEDLGGPATPGIGFGIGVERVLIALDKLGKSPHPDRSRSAFLVTLGDAARDAAPALLAQLRGAGVSADADYAGKGMKGQMRAADKSGAAYAVIIGDDELAASTAQLKTMASGEQRAVALCDLATAILA